MEVFCACPSPSPLLPALSSSFLSGFSADHQRRREFVSSVVSALLRCLFYAILAFFFGVVGTTLGTTTALTGALFGLKSKRGFLHGAAAGAIAGAYFSLEFVKASAGFWNSFADGPVSFLHLIEVISILIKPTLLYFGEMFGPDSPSPVMNQVGTVETTNEVRRSINGRGANVSSGSSVGSLPKTRITDNNKYDVSGNTISCSVCLEDFQLGEVVGILPLCHHMFHRPCISKWRKRNSSCPLCRRNQ